MSVDVTRPLVTIKQASELAGVSRRTLYNWMDRGKIEFVRTAGGNRRIYEDSLFRQEVASIPESR